MQTATGALAELIAATRFEDLPSEVAWEAKRRIADVIGAGLAGSRTPVGERITEFAAGTGKSGDCAIWGTGKRSAPAYAALANATMAFHLELDDVHRTSNTHPGVTTIPAALALAESRKKSGRDLLLAVVLGYEAQIRVGLAVSPSIFVDRTFLPPGTQGVFGATAAAAKLLGLDARTTAGALGAASYIGPLAPFESFRLGAPAKDTIMGWANLSGLHAAELAAFGFGGPGSALEGQHGFCKTVSERFDIDRLFRGLGQSFEILRTGIKPYACCRQHHTAIDAVTALKQEYGLRPEQVERIRHRTFVVASRGSDTRPMSVQAAKYSAPYTIAVALALGRNERAQYAMDLIQDPSLLALAARVEVIPDAELEALYNEKWASIVEVILKDGRVLTSRRDLPKGEPEHPLSDEELKDKFMSLASTCVPTERAGEIWNAIFMLDEMAEVSALVRLLVAG
jgi:2-methylcitrate dehydratase PrpD